MIEQRMSPINNNEANRMQSIAEMQKNLNKSDTGLVNAALS